ncbi:MAG: Coq4 family protein [Cystobacter sp.]
MPPSLPDNASLVTRLRVARQCLEVLKNDPTDPTSGQLINICLDLGVYADIVQRFQRSEEGRRLLSERPSLQGKELDLSALERLPEGTLGNAVAGYFRDNKIAPFETTLELKNDVDFIGKRYRETHDLLHVLTGYGTDVVGEMELQAFALGNLGIRTAVLILLFGTFEHLKQGRPGISMSAFLRRLRAAHRRGRASEQFLSFWFEHHWETPVTTLRDRLCAPMAQVN